MRELYDELVKAAGAIRILENEPMKKHTTFRIGGSARYFVSPSGEEALKNTVVLCRERKIPFFILGNGSNLLVSDDGYDGVVIYMGEGFSKVETLGRTVTAGGGTLLSAIAREALSQSLTGFEFAAGIPGTLGGAVVMNAGAYDGEIKQVLKFVRVMDKDGSVFELSAEELELSYRHSCIPERGLIVLSAVLELTEGLSEEIHSRMEDLAARRRDKQPLEYPSAGSTFKRPEGYFAGKLIQDAGLKGFCVGGAQVSEKHSGFVINRGNATAADICALCKAVQDKVRSDTGVLLETEIKMIGFK